MAPDGGQEAPNLGGIPCLDLSMLDPWRFGKGCRVPGDDPVLHGSGEGGAENGPCVVASPRRAVHGAEQALDIGR